MLYLDFSCQKSILCKSRSRFVYGTGSMHAGKGILFLYLVLMNAEWTSIEKDSYWLLTSPI